MQQNSSSKVTLLKLIERTSDSTKEFVVMVGAVGLFSVLFGAGILAKTWHDKSLRYDCVSQAMRAHYSAQDVQKLCGAARTPDLQVSVTSTPSGASGRK